MAVSSNAHGASQPELSVCVRTDVTADCDADGDAFNSHTETAEQAVAKVLRAGTDNDCGTFVTEHAMSALNSSTISECSNGRPLVAAVAATLTVDRCCEQP